MKKFFREFKEFAMEGNLIQMAIGIVIGAAFGKIISSFVSDILSPLLGLLMRGVNFSSLFVNLSSTPAATLAEAEKAGLPVLAYGRFLQNVIDFLIQAFAIFLVLKAIIKFRKEDKTEEPKPARLCPYCKTEIADDATKCPHCTSEL